MNEGRRSMGGRIYQGKSSQPITIFFKNSKQRQLNYPIKGDTSFDPNEYGRKHLSPKHSAIHSIIFNDNFKDLLNDKEKIIKSSRNNKSYQNKLQNKLNETKNIEIHEYVDDFLRKQHRSGSFHHSSQYENVQKVQKGQLYRQNSIDQVFHPLLQRSQMAEKSQKQNIFSSRIMNSSNLGSSNYKRKQNPPHIQAFAGSTEFPRYINPNNLNSVL